jgi:tetratricopeptide (TPR) repeat protein
MQLVLAAAALAAAAPTEQHHDNHPQLGEVSFETSCQADAAARFTEGISWLHSFEYEQAARAFEAAAALDPHCGIAHWGMAMSYFHPLWAAPSTSELAKGRQALANARNLAGGSPRELAYVAALEAFYHDSDRQDHKARVHAYSAAMKQLHGQYPKDLDGAVFYALSLVAAGTMDADPGFTKEREAGAILNRVLELEPNHPGVAHYLIHSFDYPSLADLALPAARRYAGIAPASPHAQHMPSHIFVRLGLWDEAILSNKASEALRALLQKRRACPIHRASVSTRWTTWPTATCRPDRMPWPSRSLPI